MVLGPVGAICAVLVSTIVVQPASAAVPPVASVLAQTRSSAAAVGGAATLSIDQAIVQAQRTGASVAVPASTTANSTTTANPDGTIAVSSYAVPVRKKVGGAWQTLDATLQRQSDGSIAPAVTTGQLRIGGAGSTHLAVQGSGSSAFAVDMPFPLTTPTLSGDTATYANVLSGVDLVVTADKLGGFSEVLVVKSAAAAANPALSTLALKVSGSYTLSADAGGNVAAKDAAGTTVAIAPTPLMWDSARPAGAPPTTTDPSTGQVLDNSTGLPVQSSAASPGEAAQVVPVATATAGSTLKLAPDKPLLTSANTVWPVYLDPSFTNPHIGGDDNSWATVRSAFPTTSYVKTKEPLSVGYQGWESPTFKSRAFVQFALENAYHGSTVISAGFTILESYSPSCDARRVDMFHTGAITSTTSWNNQPSKGAAAGHLTAAHGYNTSCPKANIAFNDALSESTHELTSILQTGANDNWTKVGFGLYANDEADKYAWKKFQWDSAHLDIVYNHTPDKPSTPNMRTSPKTNVLIASSCAATPTNVSTIGKGDVTFTVYGSDPDGGTIGVGMALFQTGNATQLAGTPSNQTVNMVKSGTGFPWPVDESIFEAKAKDAAGNPKATDFYWRVHIYDGYSYSDWSPECHFVFDPTFPGTPTVTVPTTGLAVGTSSSVTIHPPMTGTAPAKYQWSLNGAAPYTVTATAGTATISVTPTRIIGNVLTVASVSAGGNIGTAAEQPPFDAAAPPAYADNDLNGDGLADQLTVGGVTGTPTPGLWLAQGTGAAGQFITATKNIGTDGTGANTTGTATEFNGSAAITGLFTGGNSQGGTQDQLAYFPSTGHATILPGNSDGTIQAPVSATAKGIESLANDAGYNPTQVVNAGNTSGNGTAFPDLLGTASPTGTGLALYLIANLNDPRQYATVQLTNTTPTGATDWTNWRLASAQATASGTNLYLWNTSTKALYLWRSTAYIDNGDGTGRLTGNQYTVAASWNPTNVNSLEAADLNADGITDLRVVNTAGVATPYLVTALPTATTIGAAAGTTGATITTKPAQTLTWTP